jgi:2,3-bisphosphoglycerate-independent phosphoglycerate mutase
MHGGLKILFVFVDGLGIGSDDPNVNPLADRSRFPHLGKILAQSIPLDVALGVPGLPQSATGQAALLTGLNAAQLMGRHIEGFPPPRLKELVQEHNIFSKLLAAGKTSTFANAYWLDDVAHISASASLRRDRPARRASVTTVATLAAFGAVRGKADLLANRAVYHDLTREKLRDRGYEGPFISPEEAAEHLIGIANDHDFTLFEFFETDHAGHNGDLQKIFNALEKLDRFFGALFRFDGLLIVTSDHGNIEDSTARTHTANPVPLFASDPEPFRGLQNIAELTPKLLKLAGV